MHEYVLLNSIDPARNRNRAYAITLINSASNQDVYIVRQSWGRGDPYKNAKKTYFQDIEQVEKYIGSLLTRRKRNGYSVAMRTQLFPPVPPLAVFDQDRSVPVQMSLF